MARKSRMTAPAGESRSDRFRRTAIVSMNKALKAIARIGDLSGARYDYTVEEVDLIRSALEAKVEATLVRFVAPEMDFKFDRADGLRK